MKDAISHYEMGKTLLANGNIEGASRHFKISMDISPRPITYQAMGNLLVDMHEFEEGIAYLEMALLLVPGNPQITADLDRARAMAALAERGEPLPMTLGVKKPVSPVTPEVGLETPPEIPPVPPTVGGQTPPSSPGKEQTTQVSSPVVETLNEAKRARLRRYVAESRELIAENRLEEAVEHLTDRALIEFPEEGRLYYNLGYARQLQEKPELALEAYLKAIELGYAGADAYNNLGFVYQSLGRSDEALKSHQKAVDLGGFPEASYHLGELLERRGKIEEALQAYEEYLTLEPDGKYAVQARERVELLRRRR